MRSPDGAPYRDLLLDPGFWRPRLDRLVQVPRSLLIFPRPDLGRPGIEVVELRMRAHDSTWLRCLLGRPSFCQVGDTVHVSLACAGAPDELDWGAIEDGETDLVFSFPEERRLEDRVLDVLRVAMAAGSVESTDWQHVDLRARAAAPCDELVLAGLLRQKGWL